MAASSSNPFRSKAGSSLSSSAEAHDRFPPLDAIDTSQINSPPPKTSFKDEEDDEPSGQEAKPKSTKPAKKVRVLTPPPLSPDSPEMLAHSSQLGNLPQPDAAFDEYDVFGGVPATQNHVEPALPVPQAVEGGPPANPFSKTLQDIEGSQELNEQRKEEGEALKAANTSKPAMDVDAFRRLLLTGKAAGDAPPAELPVDDTESTQQKGKKAPPPPPSSRHGKTLRAEVKSELEPEVASLATSEAQSSDEEDESSEEQSSESEEDDSDEAEAEAPAATPKRALPAPPPRRRAGADDDEPPSQIASPESKAEQVKSPNAPAPPPPRRPHANPKQNSAQTTPSASTSSVPQAEAQDSKPGKVAAPPPPPTRSRRPMSIHGAEAVGKRIPSAKENSIAPPPPPPRQRGSSEADRASSGKSADILADLDALRREVDALRGQMN